MTEPEPRAPAPGELELVESFINSVELPDGVDELGTLERASQWLTARGNDVAQITERDRRLLIELREGLRDLLEAHTGEEIAPDVCARVQSLLAKAPLRPVLSAQGAALVSDAPGALGFVGRISAAIAGAGEESWMRLKVCRSDSCRWAYYDHSKNGRGAWCSMQTCGSQAKARAYRERKRYKSAITEA